MSFQWITACATVIIVLLAAKPYIDGDTSQSKQADSTQTPVTVAQTDTTTAAKEAPVSESKADKAGGQGQSKTWSDAKHESAEAVGAISDATKRSASNAWEGTKSASQRAWNATKEGASDAAKASGETASKAWDATVKGASDAADATAETAAKAWEATKSTSKGIWDRITESASAITGGSDEPAPASKPQN